MHHEHDIIRFICRCASTCDFLDLEIVAALSMLDSKCRDVAVMFLKYIDE